MPNFNNLVSLLDIKSIKMTASNLTKKNNKKHAVLAALADNNSEMVVSVV